MNSRCFCWRSCVFRSQVSFEWKSLSMILSGELMSSTTVFHSLLQVETERAKRISTMSFFLSLSFCWLMVQHQNTRSDEEKTDGHDAGVTRRRSVYRPN